MKAREYLQRFKLLVLLILVMLMFGGNVAAQTPHHYNYENVGTITNNFPLGMPAGRAVNWIFLPGEFSQPSPVPPGKRITKICFYMSITGPPKTYTNLHIMMRQDTDTAFTVAQFDPGPWDTVFVGDTTLQGFVNQWMGITLQKKFNYDPTKSLKVFVGQCAATGNGGGTIRMILLPGFRRVWSEGGCPFVPWTTIDARIPNFGIDVETATSVESNSTPVKFKLYDNYPNPFNPSTTIRYALPHTSFVTLIVHNTLGQQVSQLVNEEQQAGYHDVVFRGDGLASGVYFYRIQAGDFVASRKLLLLK